jgi:hypothetical protein
VTDLTSTPAPPIGASTTAKRARREAGWGARRVRARRWTSVNFSTGPTGLFSWQVFRESYF